MRLQRRRRGILQADRGKGVLQTWSVNKANSRESAPVFGNLSGSKGRRGGEEGGSVTGAGLKHAPVSYLYNPASFLSNYCVSLSLIPVCKLFQPSVVSLDCRVSSYLLLSSPSHFSTMTLSTENIIYLLFSCKSLVTLC